ncbi:hypothetical protein [Microbacterium immunditiarum]|uniref:Uncharacterized protein n=1 Tax=Microbacterium immunditiarum TaxID=337480 RepID=A0A7Y9GNY2_9MICO|nr:hypothetical protein [Microbacterium immunditiarum]NYE20013.1 hypothetical protein [Microbacterium immunditiarum]
MDAHETFAPTPAPEELSLGEELNRDFYAHSPSQYLRTRITLLITFGDSRAPAHQAVSDGVQAWNLGAQFDATPDEDETDEFAVVESISIMYLAAEALIRLFFAHVDGNSCPPLRLSSLTSYAKFKQKTASLLTNPPDVDSLRRVFRGMSAPPSEVTEDMWAEDAEVLQFLVRRAAELLVNEPNVYNATKHGLAVQPRKSAMKLGSETDPLGVIIDHHGSSVRYLNKMPSDEVGVQHWRETVQFTFPSINLATAIAFADEIDAVHAVAKCRLLDESGSISIRRRSLLKYLQRVPFGANYTGLLSMAMNRDFQVAVSPVH